MSDRRIPNGRSFLHTLYSFVQALCEISGVIGVHLLDSVRLSFITFASFHRDRVKDDRLVNSCLMGEVAGVSHLKWMLDRRVRLYVHMILKNANVPNFISLKIYLDSKTAPAT